MRTFIYTVIALATFLAGSASVQAQSYKYSTVRKDYVYDDGFGIPHSKMVAQQGEVSIGQDEITIDGVAYRMTEKGVYKNAKGRSVDLSFSYNGRKLAAVRISTGNIINNYIVDEAPSQNVADAKQAAVAAPGMQR